jgi:PAS domain S-box-containing protein/putative nucleotidyltransferase with HDIG domain
VNPRFAEIFGYASASDLIGVEPTTLVVERDRGVVAENIRSRLEGEAQSISYGFTAVRKDGSLIDVGVHGARATHDGRPAIIGMLQDVSDRKRTEEQIQRYVAQLEHAFMNTIEVATTLIEMRDPYTAGHEKRVAEISVAIGIELGLDNRRIEGLRVGGYIHDIGKIIVPAEILTRPGKLSPAEYQLIKGHAQAGYDILKNVDFPWPVADIAYQHHERMDGSGYPRGLKGEEILLEARITAVADVVEAMASHRPYRTSLGLESALAEIERGRGGLYDPQVVDACLRLFREKNFVLPG